MEDSAGVRILVPASGPRCRNCTIRLDSITTLGDIQDNVSLEWAWLVYLPASHRYVAAPAGPNGPDGATLYGENGRLVSMAPVIGQGPGQVQGFVIPVGIGPQRVALLGAGRILVLSDSLTPEANAALPLGIRATAGSIGLTSGGLAVNTITPDHAPVVLLDSTFSVMGECGPGAIPSGQQRFDPNGRQRQVAEAPSGEIVAADVMYHYEITAYDPATCRPVWSLRPNQSWFPSWTPEDAPGPPWLERPRPRIMSIGFDSTGNLWVIGSVADRKWRERPGPEDRPGNKTPAPDFRVVYDAVVDVWDPKRGELIATERFDPLLSHWLGDGRVFGRADDDSTGLARLRVWRLRLEGE